MKKVMGYLLDTNIVSYLAKPNDPNHGKAKELIESLTGHITISTITMGEIEFGLHRAKKPDVEQQNATRSFLKRYRGDAFGFDENTVEAYALIRTQLWDKHARKKDKRPEELRDATGKSLGIDERDLLIVSIAAEYNYVLVTADGNVGMKRIEQAINALQAKNKLTGFTFEYLR